MTWSLETSRGNESAKIRWALPPYTRGRVLDLGCGPFKAFAHFIGVDNMHHAQAFGQQYRPDLHVETCEKLDLIASRSCDAVFSSHLLEHIPYENVPATLAEWFRVLKKGGHLILYVPDEDEYPKVGEKGANPDHKWNVNYDRVMQAMDALSWDLVEYEKRNEDDEYSLFFVFRKL